MKTKKQREITSVQIKTAEKKLIVLEHRRQHTASQTIPLRAILKKFILQNGVALERFSRGEHPGSDKIRWAISKIKRGYFYDATLKHLVEIAHILNVIKWEG